MREFPRSSALFVGLVVLAELAARAAVVPVGNLWAYWEADAAVRFESLAARGPSYRLVLVGDSTAAWNLAPFEVRAGAGWSGPALNIGQAGNFPAAFRCSTLPILSGLGRWPGTVVASFAPGQFVARSARSAGLQEGVLESPLCRSRGGEALVHDYVHLARVRAAGRHLLRLWSGEPLLPAQDDGGYRPPPNAGGTPPVRAPRSGATAPRAVDAAAIAVLRELSALAAAREARLVLLLPPTLDDWAPYARVADQILAMARPPHVRVVDWRDRRGLTPSDFADRVHLNRGGAQRFSHLLGAELAAQAP
ncbi:MAG: hypothetical protein KJ067_21460 [Vicinamibacteria bacterium]|nr:hypothetical protein [Vicinamibacteria bacterium]